MKPIHQRRSKLKVAIVLLAIVLCIQTIKSATCGNGIIETGEACDDGNSIMSDGCTGCTIDLGYTCTGAVISVCTNTYHCGNGVRESPEQCDDGNNLPFDGCDPTCKVYTGWTCSGNNPDKCTEICGDGLDFHKYACDDGNNLYEDGCSPTCTIYTDFRCGGGDAGFRDYCFEVLLDGKDYGWYGCDTGDFKTCDGCDQYGRIEPGYTCNRGRPNLSDICWPHCGDGLRVCPEGCDDGNNNSGDGCSSSCVVEDGYVCNGGNYWRADFCYEICGDGLDIGFYDCDDGNIIGGDGCDPSCKIELGYTCGGGSYYVADKCKEICGDGLDYYHYPCDDGNLVNGDGCTSTCNIEPGWACQYGTNDWADQCWHWHNNPAIISSSINNDTTLSIYFNVSVTLPTTYNEYFELEVGIYGPRTERLYYEVASYSFQNKSTTLITPKYSTTWILNLTYSDKIQFLGDGFENITVKVLDRTKVTHYLYGFILINDKVAATVYNPTENDRSCEMEEWWTIAYWLYLALVINNFSFFLIGASLWHTIGITMSLQMIIYFPMMHNYPPSCLPRFFKDFEITIGKVSWFNVQELILGVTSADLVPNGSTPYRFERAGFVRYNMLYNCIELLMLYAVALASVVVIFLLRIVTCNNSLIAFYEWRHRWDILIKGFVLVYQHVVACCLLNILHPSSSVPLDSTAFSLSFIILGTFIGGYLFIAALILFFSRLSRERRQKWFFGGLFRDLDTSHASKYCFYIFYLGKRTIFAFTFAIAFDWGRTPMNITAFFVVLLPLMYLCFSKPFEARLTNIHMIYNEMNEMLITSMYFNYYDGYLTDFEFYIYARITVIDIALWVVISYIIFLLSLPRVCRCKCPQRKPKIYLPEYEEEIEQQIESPVSSEHDYVLPAAHVDVKEAKRRLDSFSDEEHKDNEREVIDDDIDNDLDELERDPNANL